MDSPINHGGQQTTTTAVPTITTQDAQRATAAINEYMANWPKKDSDLKGARVTTIGAFHGTFQLEPCTYWLVTDWDRRLPHLLFAQRADGSVRLTSGDFYFLEENLYPPVASTPSEGDLAASQEGGAA